MIISRLVKKGSSVDIHFIDGTVLKAAYEIVVKHGLRKDDDIEENKIQQIKKSSDLFLIKNTAFRLLGRRIHSRYELKLKLIKRKYETALIEDVLAELHGKGYLDDEKYAEQYIEEKIRINKSGLNKIKRELILRGISKEIIEEKLSQYENKDEVLNNALLIATRKIKEIENKGLTKIKVKQKIYSALLNRGYNPEIISQVIEQLNLNDSEET